MLCRVERDADYKTWSGVPLTDAKFSIKEGDGALHLKRPLDKGSKLNGDQASDQLKGGMATEWVHLQLEAECCL